MRGCGGLGTTPAHPRLLRFHKHRRTRRLGCYQIGQAACHVRWLTKPIHFVAAALAAAPEPWLSEIRNDGGETIMRRATLLMTALAVWLMPASASAAYTHSDTGYRYCPIASVGGAALSHADDNCRANPWSPADLAGFSALVHLSGVSSVAVDGSLGSSRFRGWARNREDCVDITFYANDPQMRALNCYAFQRTATGWTRITLGNEGWIWAQPYATGWHWGWTQRRGWFAINTGMLRGYCAGGTVDRYSNCHFLTQQTRRNEPAGL